MLTKLGFDFNHPNGADFIDRFFHLIGYGDKEQVTDFALQLYTFSLSHTTFLNYRGSQIAACCVIIAANIQKRDDYKIMYKYEDSRKVSPKKRNTDGLMSNVNTSYSDLNIDLWNTELA